MLFSTVYAPSLLLFGLGSVLANPVPNSGDELKNNPSAVEVEAGVYVLTGEPEIVGRGVEDKLEKRQIIIQPLTPDQSNALSLHNKERASLGLPALAWDPYLAQEAKKYAIALAQLGQLQHSTTAQRPNQGENLAYVSSTNPISNPATIGTQGWLAEKANYHGEIIPQGNFASYGHYTQAVWKTSTKIGIASATDGKGAWYTVGRYSPPGNIQGLKPF